jgi:hypothetical protein
MSVDFEDRIRLIADWDSKENFKWTVSYAAKSETFVNYFKTLVYATGTDGIISDKEHAWIVGYATATIV